MDWNCKYQMLVSTITDASETLELNSSKGKIKNDVEEHCEPQIPTKFAK